MKTYTEIGLPFEMRAMTQLENRQYNIHGRTTLNDFVS